MIKYRIYNNPEDMTAGYVETLNFEDIPEGYIEGYHYIIVEIEEPDPQEEYNTRVVNETFKYINRVNDGQAQHAEISARLRLSLHTNLITQQEYDARVSFYSKFRDYILMGWQDKALFELNQLGYEDVGYDYFTEVYNLLNGYVDGSFNSNYSRSADIEGSVVKSTIKTQNFIK